ncbi:hypothetical protein [Microscilla marina]|uniref:Uncharacterized protein n=1 Tax=Microscilla marina ATCC 23134 TaxID=313606 RepID=A1ZSP3_MICM2|nr:hypothetical protein [Microscilla marina]EAY26623.1 hypothetical protein M23134_06152 [Microscilla marina ATCC 23134]
MENMKDEDWAKPYKNLPYIDDVKEYTKEDEALFKEIKEVLKKYNVLDKFGITLLHTHFPVKKGEIMVEHYNPEDKSQLTKPHPKEDIEKLGLVPISWRFTDNDQTDEQ